MVFIDLSSCNLSNWDMSTAKLHREHLHEQELLNIVFFIPRKRLKLNWCDFITFLLCRLFIENKVWGLMGLENFPEWNVKVEILPKSSKTLFWATSICFFMDFICPWLLDLKSSPWYVVFSRLNFTLFFGADGFEFKRLI